MRPARFRLRTLMIAVVVLAMVLCTLVMTERSNGFRRRAEYHAEAERSYGALLTAARGAVKGVLLWPVPASAPMIAFSPGDTAQVPFARACVDRYEAAVAYHSAMRRKYELASRRPWRRVEADPPAPE